MRATHRGAVANVLSLVAGLPPSQGEPVLAQTEHLPNILFSELYRLNADPYQPGNSCRTADPASIAKLEHRLRALKSCAAVTCREPEDSQ